MRDPDSFGAPPQHHAKRGVDGQSPPPGQLARTMTSSSMGSTSTQRPAPAVPGRSGSATPQPQWQQQQQQQQQLIGQEEAASAPASTPFRANTTGIDPNIYAKPPSHHAKRPVDSSSAPSPSSLGTSSTFSSSAAPPKPPRPGPPAVSAKPKPQLPPRLPPRRAQEEEVEEAPPSYTEVTGRSHTESSTSTSGSSYFPTQQNQGREQSVSAANGGYINAQAAQRLGGAGVNVPGFNIGRAAGGTTDAPQQQQASSRPQPPQSRGPNTSSFGAGTGQMSELQSRFARMKPADESSGNPDIGCTAAVHTSAPAESPPPQPARAQMAQGKRAPPPPPSRTKTPSSTGEGAAGAAGSAAAGQEPPPIPMASKPR